MTTRSNRLENQRKPPATTSRMVNSARRLNSLGEVEEAVERVGVGLL